MTVFSLPPILAVTVFGKKPVNMFAALQTQKKKKPPSDSTGLLQGAQKPLGGAKARDDADTVMVEEGQDSGPARAKRSREEGGAPGTGCGTLKKTAKNRGSGRTGREKGLAEEHQVSSATEVEEVKVVKEETRHRDELHQGGQGSLFLKRGADGEEEEVTFLVMNQYVVPPWSTERTQAAIDFTRKLCGKLGILGNITIAKAGYNAKVSGKFDGVMRERRGREGREGGRERERETEGCREGRRKRGSQGRREGRRKRGKQGGRDRERNRGNGTMRRCRGCMS